ncbi:hypothetical protein AB0B07_27460 [Streptomyces sioyaensis]|uniref:hypothetical protein n=1 Tax=Streptomyces sioyaensis TaxID=67364 RepID=UPI0033FEB760
MADAVDGVTGVVAGVTGVVGGVGGGCRTALSGRLTTNGGPPTAASVTGLAPARSWGGRPAGPARARTREVKGELPASAETSAIEPSTAQRTRWVCCAAATRRAAEQALSAPCRA